MGLISILASLAGAALRFVVGRWFAIGPDLRALAFAVAGGVAVVGAWHLVRGAIEANAVERAMLERDAADAAEAFTVNRGFRDDEIDLRRALRPGDGARRLNGDGGMFLFGGLGRTQTLGPCSPAADAAAGADHAAGG